jgi:hypothetical protein
MKKRDGIIKYLGTNTNIAVLESTTFKNEDRFGIGRTTRIDIAPRYENFRNPRQLRGYMDRLESELKEAGVADARDLRGEPVREPHGFFTGWLEYHDLLGHINGTTNDKGVFLPENPSLKKHTILMGRVNEAGFSESTLKGEWDKPYSIKVVQKTIIRPFPSLKYGELHTGDVEERSKTPHDEPVQHSWGIGGKVLTCFNELFCRNF